MKKFTYLASMLLIGSQALAQGPGPQGRMRERSAQGPNPQQELRDLGLSDEQWKKLKAIREEAQKSGRAESVQSLHKELRDLRQSFKELLKSDAPSQQVLQAFAKIQNAEQSLRQARFERVLHLRDILTPEQRKKFKGFERGGHQGRGGPQGGMRGHDDEGDSE
jgi:periplasmic protein CpxP/Spy